MVMHQGKNTYDDGTDGSTYLGSGRYKALRGAITA